MGLRLLPLPASYTLFTHRTLQGALAPGKTATNGVAQCEPVAIAFCRYFTVRFKSSVAGSLQMDFIRPWVTDTAGDIPPYSAYQLYGAPASPTATAISANTEGSFTVTCNGEFYCLLTFTPSATGTIGYVDVMAI